MSAALRIGMGWVLLCFGIGLGGCESGMEPGPSDPNTPGMPAPNPDPKPNPQPQPEPEPEPEPTIVGIWQAESGSLFPGLDTVAFLRAMTLDENGTGRVYVQDRNEEFTNCVAIEYLFDGDALLIDFVSLNNPLATFAYPIVILAEDTLTIAGQNNPRTKFRRIGELPAEYMCRITRTVRDFANLPEPFATDLAYLDGELYYTSQNANTIPTIESVDAATGEVGMPTLAGARPIVHTAQPEGLWGTCGCGMNSDSMLSMPGEIGSSDTMDTADFNKPVSIQQMAYDTAAEELWVHGWSEALGYVFMRVDAKAEPDVLIDTVPFEAHLTALAAYNDSLWALATVLTPSILRVDPATGEIIASYEVPDYTVAWHGLTFDNAGRLYLLGETADEKGVIVEVALE